MAGGELGGYTVLLTRSIADNAPLRSLLEDSGAQVLELPAVEVVLPDDTDEIDNAIRNLVSERFEWIVFTSRNAVHVFGRRLIQLGFSGAHVSGTRIAAVGSATGRELKRLGVDVDLQPVEANSAALARALTAQGLDGVRILLPGGNLAQPSLRHALEAAGAEVHEVVVYRIVKPAIDRSRKELVLSAGVNAVVFASPSAVNNLALMLGRSSTVFSQANLVCIGATTVGAVESLGFKPVAVAETQTVRGLFEAVCAAAHMERER